MSTYTPLVSVLLPVHNNEQYIKDAIQSILDQTYQNFELLILISATTNEESLKIINSFQDQRIKKIHRTPDENLPKALNRGIEESKGEYIARMDADDISLPHRFERQIRFMQENPGITIVGSWVKTFGVKDNYIKHPTKPEEIKANLLFQTSMVHPTVVMRKVVMEKNNLKYNPEYWCSEDIDLWARSVEKVKLANIPEILLLYRTHPLQATNTSREKIAEINTEIRLRQLAHGGITPSPRELHIHMLIAGFKSEESDTFFNEVGKWLLKIATSNKHASVYDQKILEEVLGERWFIVCYMNASKSGLRSWNKFWKYKPSKWFKKNLRNIGRLVKFFFRSLF